MWEADGCSVCERDLLTAGANMLNTLIIVNMLVRNSVFVLVLCFLQPLDGLRVEKIKY